MRSYSVALAAAGLAASALPAAAGTLLVPQQFPTIQKALNAARPHDTVLVSPKPNNGVYNEALTISTPHVVLQGRNNPVLDGTGLGVAAPSPQLPSFIAYPNGIEIRASHVTVSGLTVQNTGGLPYGNPAGVNVGYVTPDGQNVVSFSDIKISGVTFRNDYNGVTIEGLSLTNFANGGTYTLVKGYQLLGNVFTGNSNTGASVIGASILIADNRFTNNSFTGLSIGDNTYFYGAPPTQNVTVSGNQFTGSASGAMNANGDGLTVTGNEVASNPGPGLSVSASIYNPAVHDPASPNPPASAVTLNYVHDNQGVGLTVGGTVTVSGNVLTKNTGNGLFLSFADYSTVTYNLITDTILQGYGSGDGTGIYADAGFGSLSTSLAISANEVSDNAGDGIFLAAIVGSKVSDNDASANDGIGIHLSDATRGTTTPNTVTQNLARHNAIFDARDDTSATGPVIDNGNTYSGDGVPTANVWTKNLFGTTDPVGLSK